MKKVLSLFSLLFVVLTAYPADIDSEESKEKTLIHCGNLIYAKSKSSVCFADRFLTRVATETNLNAAKKFTPVKLGSDDLFKIPITVFSGEGAFQLTEKERENFKKYLELGGFVIASPGCSNDEWDMAFRKEIKTMFGDRLKKIQMTHEIFSMVYKVPRLTLSHGGTTLLEGISIDGRLVLVYSKDGLNDIRHAKGCCCCGGDQVNECERVNVNIFTYALLY